MSEPERVALIDADTIIYHAGRRAEEIIDWGDFIKSWYADGKVAREELTSLVQAIAEGMNATRIVLTLSDYDNPNWRLNVLPTYKLERAKTAHVRRPMAWLELREFCKDTYETFLKPTLEGDDVLGILMTHPHLIKGEKVIVSIDKDMKTIPGLHSNFTRNGNEFGWEVMEQSQAAADYFHLEQTLTGDTTDGYKGCPGVGKVNAQKILDAFLHEDANGPFFDVHGAWPAVVLQYEKKGLTAEDALVQARVARICRYTDYDFNLKEVKLWNPPK